MAGRKQASYAAALVVVLIVAGAAAAAGALIPVKICGVDQTAVNACKPYCKVGSTLGSPGDACCGKVQDADWDCLCQFKARLPSDVDARRVMDLATKCATKYQPTSPCGVN